MDKKPAKREKRPPKKISKTYLENAGLYYLQQYASSVSNFRQVMMRKVKRSCLHHKISVDDFIPMVEDLVQRYTEVGLIDDTSFARGKVASLRRKGFGRQAIISKLQAKGLSIAHIEISLSEVDEDSENAELEAALAYTKRKRLGKYSTRPITDPEKDRRKELASLARAGFSYDIADKALKTNNEG